VRFEDWCPQWEAMAASHEALGDEALRQSNTVTAGEALVRAAIYYHTAQSVYFADPREKRRIQERQAAAYRKAMPYLRPPAEQLAMKCPPKRARHGGSDDFNLAVQRHTLIDAIERSSATGRSVSLVR